MSSQRKIDSARANGAKSRGPKTEQGKSISSQNALTHGLYSANVVLHRESRQEYEQMLDVYVRNFQPAGQAEFDLIEEMAAAKWRMRRIRAVETELLDRWTREKEAELDQEGEDYDALTPLANSYSFLSMHSGLPFLARAESRLERCYSRSLKNLLELQRRRLNSPPPAASPEKENAETNPIPCPSVPSPLVHKSEPSPPAELYGKGVSQPQNQPTGASQPTNLQIKEPENERTGDPLRYFAVTSGFAFAKSSTRWMSSSRPSSSQRSSENGTLPLLQT